MRILSSAFGHNQFIPLKYTMDGENINPPLDFEDVPKNARELVLVVDDPDAPTGVWVHWLMWNISPNIRGITENSVPINAIQGKTNRDNCYSGPKPPSGTHRYYFKLYALEKKISLPRTANANDLYNEIEKKIIKQAELIGLYSAK